MEEEPNNHNTFGEEKPVLLIEAISDPSNPDLPF